MIVMKESVYESLIADIKKFKGSYRECEAALRLKYNELPSSTLGSIISLFVQRLMKHSYRKSPQIFEKYYQYYLDMLNRENDNIIRLSERQGITPALYVRSLLHQTYDDQTIVRQNIKDTTLIKDKNLAYQSYIGLISDNQYGPFADTIKQSIGSEYEIRLERELRLMNIPFSDENVLRSRGYDKTPDFKLDVPIAVDGFIINWIESKALFGDNDNHVGYLKEQLTCYWNRFGPGLVIYWFGYLETIEKTPEVNKMFILRTGFPSSKSITLYNMED